MLRQESQCQLTGLPVVTHVAIVAEQPFGSPCTESEEKCGYLAELAAAILEVFHVIDCVLQWHQRVKCLGPVGYFRIFRIFGHFCIQPSVHMVADME